MKNFAYVSLLSSDDYVDAIIVLNQRFKEVCSKYPFYVLTTPNLTESSWNKLIVNRVLFILGEEICYSKELTEKLKKSSSYFYVNTASKIQIYSLTQFEKIAYIDADTYLLKNIDDIFNYEDGSCVAFSSDNYAAFSGLMVISPKNYDYNFMKKIFKDYNHVDGGFFSSFYYKTKVNPNFRIPKEYLEFERSIREKIFKKDISVKNAKVIHYCSTVKPWKYKEVLENNFQHLYTYSIYIHKMKELGLIKEEH